MDFNSEITLEMVVALLAIGMSIYSLYLQRKHNKLTFKPIPVLIKLNYNNRVLIRLWNKGNGPLIVRSFTVKGIAGADNIISLMPASSRKLAYVDFTDEFTNKVINAGDYLNILEFKVRDDDKNNPPQLYEEELKNIKEALHGLIIQIEYVNIYNNKMNKEFEAMNFKNLVDESMSVEEIEKRQNIKIGQAVQQKPNQNKAVVWTQKILKRIQITR